MLEYKYKMIKLLYLFLLLIIPVFASSQGFEEDLSRGSIPEILLRPERGESPRYPEDVVIGALGRGTASEVSYFYANTVCNAFLSGNAEHPAFSSVSSVRINNYLSQLGVITPVSFRIGGGRNEADGSVSFLLRFIGRDMGITGELYVRYVMRNIENDSGEESFPSEAAFPLEAAHPLEVAQVGSWVFENIYLDDPVSRIIENQEGVNRNNIYPFERFY